jgi:hypothetical protein
MAGGFGSQVISLSFLINRAVPLMSAPPDVKAFTGASAANCGAYVGDTDLGAPSFSDAWPGVNVSRGGLPPGNTFPVGTTVITYNATDSEDNVAAVAQSVTVVDNTPPLISSVSVDKLTLSPPNHKLVDITLNYQISDNCGTASAILSVTSNEPVNGTGDGDTAPDWEIVDAHHLRLRAERAGNGRGRVYTITITAIDRAGNTSVQTVTISVPK